MKKILYFLGAVLLAFTACLVIPTDAAYATETLAEVRFVNPCDLFADSTGVYVLDKVDDSHSIIHKFNFAGTTRQSYEVNGAFDKIHIFDGVVYLLTENLISWGTLPTEGTQNTYVETATYENSNAKQPISAKDFAVFEHAPNDRILCLGENHLYTIKPDLSGNARKSAVGVENVVSCAKSGNKFYLLTATSIIPYDIYSDGTIGEASEEEKVTLSSISAFAGITLNKVFALDFDTTYYCVTDNEKVYNFNGEFLFNLLPENSVNTVKNACLVKVNDSTIALYEIQSDNKLYRYNVTKVAQNFVVKWTEGFTLGSDTLSMTIPSKESINGYTLAGSTGYPTNFIYKIDGYSHSIAEAVVLDADDKFIILDYEGSENSAYYYVMYGEKFGLIEKALGTNIRISTYSTLASQTGKANATHLYLLPMVSNDFLIDVAVARDSDMTISMELDFNGEKWYYAKCTVGETEYKGFVRGATLYQLKPVELSVSVSPMRVNPPIGKPVLLYTDSGLQIPTVDANNNQINLQVGKRVNVISTENDVSYIQVVIGEDIYYGYVATSHLIKHGMTNYMALGLSLLIVALALTVYLIIMAKRRRAHLRQAEENELLAQGEQDALPQTADVEEKKEE